MTKVGLAASGLRRGVPVVFRGALWLIGFRPSWTLPLWLALVAAAVFFLLPDLEVKRDAKLRRGDDFRRVVSAYLDLVAMNLAGGRGVPEALMSAAEISDGWAVRRIRNAWPTRGCPARPSGSPSEPRRAVGVAELVDLGNALALTADDGAKIRPRSAPARRPAPPRAVRDRGEGRAAVAVDARRAGAALRGFLVFLIYPASPRLAAYLRRGLNMKFDSAYGLAVDYLRTTLSVSRSPRPAPATRTEGAAPRPWSGWSSRRSS